MNILPKKRWHVRTKQNIERVRRDEAKAAEEEKELERRIQLAEQETRTEYLRKKARGVSEQGNLGEKSDEIQSEHVNFFKDVEENGFSYIKNKEHEAEEKERKEKFEKDLGILTYLGQNSLEAKGETPWYLTSQLKGLVIDDKDGKDNSLDVKHKTKLDKMDPLNDMKKYLAMKGNKYIESYISTKVKDSNPHKHKKAGPSSSSKRSLSIVEELRAKRLKRERGERLRSEEFLQTFRKGPSVVEEVVMDDRLRKYNSQFNPHLARNNSVHDKEPEFQ